MIDLVSQAIWVAFAPGGAAPAPDFPDATTTGVQDGITLTPRGDWDITTPGTYENFDVSGYVYIDADDVTLRNCRVTAQPGQIGGVVVVAAGKTGVVIEYCDLDGAQVQGLKGVWLDGSVASIVRFCDISHSEDGIYFHGNDHYLHDNYIHDLDSGGPDPHHDGFQTGNTTGTVIYHNTMIGAADANACVQMASPSEIAAFSLTISNNLFRPGPVMLALFNVGDGPTNPTSFTLHVTDNHMEEGHVGSGQGYYAYNNNLPTTWSGNVDADTSAEIPPP